MGILKEKELPYAYALVAGVLREGKDNSLTSKEIIKLLGWKGNDKRNLLRIIKELINKHGYVIGASRTGQQRGYYLMITDEELSDSLRPYNAQRGGHV